MSSDHACKTDPNIRPQRTRYESEYQAVVAQRDEMLEALDWYAEMARQMQRATLHMDNQTMLHLMKELALDGGRRANQARAAIAKAEGRA